MTLKYRFLLGACRLIGMQKIMEWPPAKIQKFFSKKYKGVQVPTMSDPALDINRAEVQGSTVVYYRHKKTCKKVCIYLIGGGMLKYPTPKQAKGLVTLAKQIDRDIILPYYPLILTGHTLPDAYEMLYALYKETLKEYAPEDILLLGGSSGGNLALGFASYINAKGEQIPLPGKIYVGSPGTLLLTEEERKKADRLDKTDVIMSQKATISVWDGMTGGKAVPQYMKYLQLGDYTGLSDVYLSFGGDEVFAAAADSIKSRLEEFGVRVTMEIGEGMYHTYAVMPFVKEAEDGYKRMLEYCAL